MYGKKNENLIFGFVQTCYALKTVIFFGKKVSNHFILGNFSGFQGFSGSCRSTDNLVTSPHRGNLCQESKASPRRVPVITTKLLFLRDNE
jgi:hypothetical protein